MVIDRDGSGVLPKANGKNWISIATAIVKK